MPNQHGCSSTSSLAQLEESEQFWYIDDDQILSRQPRCKRNGQDTVWLDLSEACSVSRELRPHSRRGAVISGTYLCFCTMTIAGWTNSMALAGWSGSLCVLVLWRGIGAAEAAVNIIARRTVFKSILIYLSCARIARNGELERKCQDERQQLTWVVYVWPSSYRRMFFHLAGLLRGRTLIYRSRAVGMKKLVLQYVLRSACTRSNTAVEQCPSHSSLDARSTVLKPHCRRAKRIICEADTDHVAGVEAASSVTSGILCKQKNGCNGLDALTGRAAGVPVRGCRQAAGADDDDWNVLRQVSDDEQSDHFV